MPPLNPPLSRSIILTDTGPVAFKEALAAYDGTVPPPPLALAPLTLSAAGIQEGAAAGTVVGGLLGRTSGSALELVGTAGGRFALAGLNLVAGAAPTDYETATSHQVTVRETLGEASNSPRDTVLTVSVANVFERPALGALSLSGTSFELGTPASGAINGATTGSTIAAAGLPAGLTIDGPARTWAWSGSGQAGTTNAQLTEALGDSPNSPRASALTATITDPTPRTVSYTGAQVAPGWTGSTNRSSAGRIGLRAVDTRGASSFLPMVVEGRKLRFKAWQDNPGAPKAGMIEAKVDAGSYAAVPVVGDWYELDLGTQVAGSPHLVGLRINAGYGPSAGMTADATVVLEVDGVNPSVLFPTTWLQPGDAGGKVSTGQVMRANPDGAGWTPARTPNPNGITEQVVALVCKADFGGDLWLVTGARVLSVSIDRGPLGFHDAGPVSPWFVRVPVPAGTHEIGVATSNPGETIGISNTTGGLGLLAVGGVPGAGGVGVPDKIGSLIALGDSIVHQSIGQGPVHSHGVHSAFRLGRAPSLLATSGWRISQIKDAFDARVAVQALTAADELTYHGGRNNVYDNGAGNGLTAQNKADVQAVLAAVRDGPARRVTVFGLAPEKFPDVSADLEAQVTAAGSAKVVFASTASWTGIRLGDGTHPSDLGAEDYDALKRPVLAAGGA